MDVNYLLFLNYCFLFFFLCVSFTYSKYVNIYFKVHSVLLSIVVLIFYFLCFISVYTQFAFACLFLVTIFLTFGLRKQTISAMPYVVKITAVLFLAALLLIVINFYTQSLFVLSFIIATTVLMLVLYVINRKKKTFNFVNDIIVVLEDEVTIDKTNNIEDLKKVLASIHKWFGDSKCYLNSNYSLDHLEKDLKIDRKHISLSINKLAKMNFYQFIAYYRVKYAKEMILKDNRFTLETLSSDCGFYSKSTFNKYFKKFEGQTPSRFKLSHT